MDVLEVCEPRVLVFVNISTIVITILRSELAGHEPEASSNVAHDDEDQKEEDQSLDSVAYSKDVVDVVHQSLLVLYNTNQTEKLGQFDKFVESSNLGNSDYIVSVATRPLAENKVEWHN